MSAAPHLLWFAYHEYNIKTGLNANPAPLAAIDPPTSEWDRYLWPRLMRKIPPPLLALHDGEVLQSRSAGASQQPVNELLAHGEEPLEGVRAAAVSAFVAVDSSRAQAGRRSVGPPAMLIGSLSCCGGGESHWVALDKAFRAGSASDFACIVHYAEVPVEIAVESQLAG